MLPGRTSRDFELLTEMALPPGESTDFIRGAMADLAADGQ
jgi:hypothetical protein